MTIYNLEFHEAALKEWRKLDGSIKRQFKDKLAERLLCPRVPKAQLHGNDMQDTYKIKLRNVGYRLVYEVHDQTVTVLVLSVGRRDKNQAYLQAQSRKA